MTKIIGLTGGIASGKSTVTAYLREKHYKVVDADQVVHDLQAKGGKLYKVLLDWLGSSILQKNGELNRTVLSQLIFSSEANQIKSSEIQNCIIREELRRRYQELRQQEAVFFMDIPLLFELGYEQWFDEVWLVYVDDKTQEERLMVRNNYNQEEAKQRISSQMPLEQKKSLADIIIDNSASPKETFDKLNVLLECL